MDEDGEKMDPDIGTHLAAIRELIVRHFNGPALAFYKREFEFFDQITGISGTIRYVFCAYGPSGICLSIYVVCVQSFFQNLIFLLTCDLCGSSGLIELIRERNLFRKVKCAAHFVSVRCFITQYPQGFQLVTLDVAPWSMWPSWPYFRLRPAVMYLSYYCSPICKSLMWLYVCTSKCVHSVGNLRPPCTPQLIVLDNRCTIQLSHLCYESWTMYLRRALAETKDWYSNVRLFGLIVFKWTSYLSPRVIMVQITDPGHFVGRQ